MNPMVEFDNVRKRFGKRTVLDNFNLSVAPGEIVTLMGASGSGTLLTGAIVSGSGDCSEAGSASF